MPLFGPPDIDKLKEKRDIKGLLTALKYRDSASIRRAAALALAELSAQFTPDNQSQVISALLAALDDSDSSVLPAVAVALGSIGQPAVLPLISALRDAKDRVRDGAARCLGQLSKYLNEPSYLRLPVDPLIGSLTDPAVPVRRSAAWALGRLGSRLDSEVRGLPVENLVLRLRDEAPEVREAAAVALGRLGEGRAIRPLVNALEDSASTVRKAVAEALDGLGWQPVSSHEGTVYSIAKQDWGRAGQASASDIIPLKRALQDPNPDVRKAAATALGQVAGPAAVEPLVAALKDSSGEVRHAAAAALEQAGAAPQTVEALLAVLHDPNRDVRRTVMRSLGRTGDPRAVPPLISALRLREENLVETASNALVALRGPAVDALIPLLNDPDKVLQELAANVLVQIGSPAVVPLLGLIHEAEPLVREQAVRVLGLIGDPRAVWPLVNVLPDPLLTCPAAIALGKIGDPRALQPLTELLSSQSEGVRQAAALGLGGIGDPQSVDPLINLLRAGEKNTRQDAAKALLQMYRSGKLDMTQKRRILVQADRITEKHVDHQSHVDNVRSSDCHRDEVYHLDTGIGLEFPY